LTHSPRVVERAWSDEAVLLGSWGAVDGVVLGGRGVSRHAGRHLLFFFLSLACFSFCTCSSCFWRWYGIGEEIGGIVFDALGA